jgi:hypothetical protein
MWKVEGEQKNGKEKKTTKKKSQLQKVITALSGSEYQYSSP